MSDRLLKQPELEQILGLSRTSIYNRIREGSFPKPLKIGAASRWRSSDIQAWIAKSDAA